MQANMHTYKIKVNENNKHIKKKTHKTRAGKIPQQLRTLAALAENPSSIPILGSSSKRSKVLI